MPMRLNRIAVIAIVMIAFAAVSVSAATVSVGAKTVQSVISEQLFNRSGRWYLQDDGGVCYAYLDAPHTRLEKGRVYLHAHLSSRLGQRIGDTCAGVELSSNVTISGKPYGWGSTLTLNDIRIDHLDDDDTGGAIELIRQFAPQAVANALSIDVLALVRAQPTILAGMTVRLDQFKIADVTTTAQAIVVAFDLALSSP